MTLPKWQSHKVVEAAKIVSVAPQARGAILLLDIGEERPVELAVSGEYVSKHEPQTGGYYVRYPGDGYESWSPARAFEEGYTRVLTESEQQALQEAENKPPAQMPSIGRAVHFNDDSYPDEKHPGMSQDNWIMGHVIAVHGPEVVNLKVTDHFGNMRTVERASFGTGRYNWRWPPRV